MAFARRFLWIALGLVLAASPLAAQTGEFVVAENGHDTGTASFNVTSTKDGYDSSSVVKVSMQGLDYALSKTERLSPDNNLVHVLLSATRSFCLTFQPMAAARPLGWPHITERFSYPTSIRVRLRRCLPWP
ncbi:MAG: hypothetical protein ABR928_14480 [Terracidiphilus sp.]